MSNLSKVKNMIGIGITSEYLVGIDSPPDYQCPNIDGILRELSYANKAINNCGRYDTVDDILDCVGDIENALYNLDYELEDIRDSIIQLRGWGEQWKKIAKDLLNDRDDLVEYLNLEEKLNVKI